VATRVMLVACLGSCEGPWTLANGKEGEVKVSSLGQGEHVVLEAEINGLFETLTLCTDGVFPIPWEVMKKYRVVKRSTEHRGKPTTVEVIFNG